MVNANELRIGNWVSFKGLWSGQVKDIYSSGMIVIKDNDGCFDDEGMQPINLTVKLLEEMGFEKYKEIPLGYWKELDHFKIGEFHLQYETEFTIKAMPLEPVIYHLHQLQNLYFALTGQELTYSYNSITG